MAAPADPPLARGLIRTYVPDRHQGQLRACIVALQDFEHGLEPALPRGEDMADAQLAFLVERCSRRSGRLFVAEVDGAVVGFVGVLARVPPGEPDEDVKPYAYISDLMVLAPYRRRGIGRALLDHAEEFVRAQGANMLRVGVLAKNGIARDLYQSCGFADYHVQLAKRLR